MLTIFNIDKEESFDSIEILGTNSSQFDIENELDLINIFNYYTYKSSILINNGYKELLKLLKSEYFKNDNIKNEKFKDILENKDNEDLDLISKIELFKDLNKNLFT